MTAITIQKAFGEKIKKLKSFDLLEENDKELALTQKGSFFADEVTMQFYNLKYLPFPKSLYADAALSPYNN